MVALESTLIAHGLPRPGNPRRPGSSSRPSATTAPSPATIAVLDGEVRVGLDDAALALDPGATTSRSVSVRDLPVAWPRAGTARRPSPRPPTSPPAPASRCSPPAGSAASTARRARRWTSRPTSTRSRAHGDLRRLLRGEVDPRRPGHARAAGDARRRRRSATGTDALPRLLPDRLRPPGGLAGRHAAEVAAALLAARASWARRRCAGGRQPAARPTSSSTPTLHDARSPRRWPAAAARRDPRAGRHAVPARALPRRDRRREPTANVALRAANAAARRRVAVAQRGALRRVIAVACSRRMTGRRSWAT